jgi:hypothetical protein
MGKPPHFHLRMETDPISKMCPVQNTVELQFNDPQFKNFPYLAFKFTNKKSMINLLHLPRFSARIHRFPEKHYTRVWQGAENQ